MAQKRNSLDLETFSCSICVALLKDPVTLPCGHSYCLNCVSGFWDLEDKKKKTYSCPQCRREFTARPELGRNTMLVALVEQLKKIEDGDEDVSCDFCIGSKVKALKSCLTCLASYCEDHLRPHYDSGRFRKHELVDPLLDLQENICPRHDELMKMFCRTDWQKICYLCSVDEHKGHDTVSAAAERSERRKELEASRQDVQKRIRDREEDVKLLQEHLEVVNRSADKATEDSERIFDDLVRQIQKRSSEVKRQIRAQQETEVGRVKDVQEKLRQEIDDLKLISRSEDLDRFLKFYKDTSRVQIGPLRCFEDLKASILELRDRLQDVLRYKRSSISEAEPETGDGFLKHLSEVTHDPNTSLIGTKTEPETRDDFLKYSSEVTLDPNTSPIIKETEPETRDRLLKHLSEVTLDLNTSPIIKETEPETRDGFLKYSSEITQDPNTLLIGTKTEPETRAEFLKYWSEVTLDPNTANTLLLLSDDNRKAEMTGRQQPYPDHRDRFNVYRQVLSSECLTGRCYWEAEVRGVASIAVAYDSISRAGDSDGCVFGRNSESWRLDCSSKGFSFWSDSVRTPVSGPASSRIGVFLDHEAGLLAFYSVSETMNLLHRVQTRFSRPLHAGFCLDYGASAEFVRLKQSFEREFFTCSV